MLTGRTPPGPPGVPDDIAAAVSSPASDGGRGIAGETIRGGLRP